ncbi:hypothetical protein [Saccharothrix algeriensis]|uniref:Small secreted protein n=1 Tax=Saccharothrix algeriensis TaxID=173560 RepID=A0A8T8I4N9_9PSEU|nr:hypothetical protein [Saccharothrix algeriensis]MBM7811868.1 hypothetical protein [Saccharothrix algeriensis]QTR05591.1 hypothetical protein J7S33_14040 [Saccharothrix algeriensis]
MKHRTALVGVLAAVLLTGACSGSSGSAGSSGSTTGTSAATTTTPAAAADPVKWTGTFCEGIAPTVESVMQLLKVMLEGGANDPAAQKAALMEYSTKSGKSMADAGAKLDALGAPSPEAQALHDELVKFFTESGKSLNTASEELAKLDPNDPEFATKLEQLGGDEADPTKLQEQIKKLQDDPELGAAFKQAPECVAMSDTLKNLGG